MKIGCLLRLVGCRQAPIQRGVDRKAQGDGLHVLSGHQHRSGNVRRRPLLRPQFWMP